MRNRAAILVFVLTLAGIANGQGRSDKPSDAAEAPASSWALYVLRSQADSLAYWLAEDEYARQSISTAAADEDELPMIKSRAMRQLEGDRRRIPEVAWVRAVGSEGVFAQVSEMGDSLSLILSTGEKKLVKKNQVKERTALEPQRRAAELAKYYRSKSAGNPGAFLSALGRLALHSDGQKEVMQALSPTVREVMKQIEKACAGCAGVGQMKCRDCDGRGKRLGQLDCDVCSGTRKAKCQRCLGDLTVACKRCRGDGRRNSGVTRGGIWVRPRTINCNYCADGTVRCKDCKHGKVVCKRCDQNGKIEGKEKCGGCVGKKTTTCIACDGAGLRSAMTADYRRIAEQEARQPNLVFTFRARGGSPEASPAAGIRINEQEAAELILQAMAIHFVKEAVVDPDSALGPLAQQWLVTQRDNRIRDALVRLFPDQPGVILSACTNLIAQVADGELTLEQLTSAVVRDEVVAYLGDRAPEAANAVTVFDFVARTLQSYSGRE